MLRIFTVYLAFAIGASAPVEAADFLFDTAPFQGSTALETPGRQIVGGELFVPAFDFEFDRFVIRTDAFDMRPDLGFFNGEVGDIPLVGTNVIVLRTFDSDGDPLNGNQLNAGQAANLIANHFGSFGADPAAGFFVYFNSGLDLPRLVFSTDLASNQADLKVVARFTGLVGDDGRSAMASFTARNFQGAVPEPASWAMLICGFGIVGAALRRRRIDGLQRPRQIAA